MSNVHRWDTTLNPRIRTPRGRRDEFLYHIASDDDVARPYSAVQHVERKGLPFVRLIRRVV